ncbi:tyrosine-type recombinase/integrase [Candidatus Albibeggiatoa sp. nov. BB20]|uniref:tyrosine-type recombinase/integrase n=1 Tax=Candidatus Albibeggiatoa sp. nov. BB20 TaxID=3162723 RepID=UPI0033659E13
MCHISVEQLFRKSYHIFRRTLKKCSFKVRDNQASHVLRHTFATYFIANGGNILALKEILGHSDMKMTMIYAQYSLEQAKVLNPLTAL